MINLQLFIYLFCFSSSPFHDQDSGGEYKNKKDTYPGTAISGFREKKSMILKIRFVTSLMERCKLDVGRIGIIEDAFFF